MATIAENIHSMAALVAEVKKSYRLNETTIMRIVDMNFALAQQNGTPSFGGDEDFPIPDEPKQLTMFPDNDADTAAALGIVPDATPEEE